MLPVRGHLAPRHCSVVRVPARCVLSTKHGGQRLTSAIPPHTGPFCVFQGLSFEHSGCKSFIDVLVVCAKVYGQAIMNSRAALASVSLFTAGTIAWYTHLYGNLPFLGEVHASHLSDEGLHPPTYPWSHKGVLDTFDHAR